MKERERLHNHYRSGELPLNNLYFLQSVFVQIRITELATACRFLCARLSKTVKRPFSKKFIERVYYDNIVSVFTFPHLYKSTQSNMVKVGTRV